MITLDELGISTEVDGSNTPEELLTALELATKVAVDTTTTLDEVVVTLKLEAELLTDEDLAAVDVDRVTALVELARGGQLVDDEILREELEVLEEAWGLHFPNAD
jgi:hypothetical protein